jgi:hypothetical protein
MARFKKGDVVRVSVAKLREKRRIMKYWYKYLDKDFIVMAVWSSYGVDWVATIEPGQDPKGDWHSFDVGVLSLVPEWERR